MTFESVMAFMYQQTHSTESAVLRYEYWRGQKTGLYYCLLSFPSAEAFWAHQASDHHEGEMERFSECIAELDLEPVDPVALASPLPATETAEPDPAWADEIQQQAAQFPVQLASWWFEHRN